MGNDLAGSAEDRFGRAVRRHREELGLKQADLAQRAGALGLKMHPSAIAKIELRDVDNPRSIRINEAEVLAQALGVNLDQLLGESSRAREMAGLLNTSLTRVQALRERLVETLGAWVDSQHFLAELVATIEEEEGLVDQMEDQVLGVRGVVWPEALEASSESLSNLMANLERQYAEHPDETVRRDLQSTNVVSEPIANSRQAKFKSSASGRFVKTKAKKSNGEHPEA